MHHDSSHDTPAPITPAELGISAATATTTTATTSPPSDMPTMPKDKVREALREALEGVDWHRRPEFGPGHRVVALALKTCGAGMAERFIMVKYGGELWRKLWSETVLFGPKTFGADELVDWALALRFAGSSDPTKHLTEIIRHAAALRLLLSPREAEELAQHITGKLEAVIC